MIWRNHRAALSVATPGKRRRFAAVPDFTTPLRTLCQGLPTCLRKTRLHAGVGAGAGFCPAPLPPAVAGDFAERRVDGNDFPIRPGNDNPSPVLETHAEANRSFCSLRLCSVMFPG